ncbi:sigma-70 family RNA polymerase sigma factor [Bacillus timonensis]|nr:sigma-70 family RNA polymerase sigma factor [Bacillus timonensis]
MCIRELPFEELEKEYKPILIKVMKSLNLYRDFDSFYQVALIGLWEAQMRFNEERGTRFSTFAFTTVRGKLLDELNKENKYYDHAQPLSDEILSEIVDTQADVPLEEEIVTLYSKDLSPNQLKWFTGKFIEDKKLADIAREEGVTVEAVKSWGREAKKKIRRNALEME